MKKHLFDPIPESMPQELVTDILRSESVRIERIVSFGQASPDGFWYDQSESEWVLLREGSAQIRGNDRLRELGPGDYLNIPAGTRHRVEKTAENARTVWLAVFYK